MLIFDKLARLICIPPLAILVVAVSGLLAASASGLLAQQMPDRYVVDYPVAARFCPPIRTYFFDVEQTIQQVGGRIIRHQPNGGYGLPVRRKVEGRNLLHLGADVGWHRVGEPVFSVADGVVRASEGPPPKGNKKEAMPRGVMTWGNLVVVEHRLPGDRYVTTVYGHLGQERLVQAGQIIRAGQQIGTIGKQNVNVNGGYKPHLHFGVRKGRFAEPGAELFRLSVDGTIVPLMIADVTEQYVELDDSGKASGNLAISIDGRRYDLERTGDTLRMPSEVLWHVSRPRFSIVGYGLSATDWHDPTELLREHRADLDPAPFSLGPPAD